MHKEWKENHAPLRNTRILYSLSRWDGRNMSALLIAPQKSNLEKSKVLGTWKGYTLSKNVSFTSVRKIMRNVSHPSTIDGDTVDGEKRVAFKHVPVLTTLAIFESWQSTKLSFSFVLSLCNYVLFKLEKYRSVVIWRSTISEEKN